MSFPDHDFARPIKAFINKDNIEVLYVAGSRASKDPEIYDKTFKVVEACILWAVILCQVLLEFPIARSILYQTIEEVMNTTEEQQMNKKHKDICRIDQDSKLTYGWYVRIRFQGKMKSKFFPDKKCGGRETALESAIEWRNSTEKNLGKIRTDKHIVTHTNSRTGVVGVRLNEKLKRYEIGWVTVDGKQGKTSVSIRKYGNEAAFVRACSIRQEKEQIRLESQ